MRHFRKKFVSVDSCRHITKNKDELKSVSDFSVADQCLLTNYK